MLHRDLYENAVLLTLTVDDILIQRSLALIQILDKLADTALIVEGPLLPGLHSLIGQSDPKTLCQKSSLSESLLQRVEIIIQRLKDGTVGHKGNLGPALIRITLTDDLQSIHRIAALVSLLVHLSFMENLYLKIIRQSIDDRSSDTVKTSGNLISPSAELTAGMKNGKHDFNGRLACLFIDSYGNTAPVIKDCN